MPLVSSRQLFLLASPTCVAVMGGVLYPEHVVDLETCPLYVVQRISFTLIGLTCPAGVIRRPGLRGRRIYSVLVFLLVLGSGAMAIRQIWLQTVPLDQLSTRLPGLDYMMQALPSQEVIRLILRSTTDCAQVSWTPFTLSIPEWSLLVLVAYLGFFITRFL